MPIPPGIPGNAMTWIDNAIANPEYGITVGNVPLTGSVIVMQPEHSFAHDVFGHVMYVERVENGQIWVTDNFHHQPVLLNDMTDELAGPYIQYMYFPWQTQG
jgi:surface antigen